MFFREKKSKKSQNPTLQLVENIRDGGKVKQKIILSLGVGFEIAKGDRQAVARAIEKKLSHQTSFFNLDKPKIKRLADKIVKKIQTAGKWNAQKELIDEQKEHIAEVYIDKVEHEHDRVLGPLLIGHTFWHRLGFAEILKQCDFNDRQINVAELSVLNRLISQDSENAIPSWLATVAAEELVDKAAEDFAEDRFYTISDRLFNHKKFIEEQLYEREKNLFNLNNAIYLYDLTNTYFEGLCKRNPKAQFNKNQKEKRSDCRQIVIALVLDQQGFIRRHYVFKGKTTDSKSLEGILTRLKSDFENAQLPTIIMDRGIVTKENIKLVKSYGLHYIVATRSGEEKRFLDDFVNTEFKVLKDDKNNKVEVYLKREADETYLLCKSQARFVKEQSMRNRAEEKLDEEIANWAKLIETGKRVDPCVVERSIGRIKERHAKVSHYYAIDYEPFSFVYEIPQNITIAKRLSNSLQKLKQKADQYDISHLKLKSALEKLSQKYPDDYSKLSIYVKEPTFSGKPLDEKKEKLQSLDGNYLLKTDRDDLTDSEIWHLYVMLTRAEDAFRNLKTDLKMRPNFHQIEKRVEGHVFITILAYHILHSIEQTLREKKCSSSWATIKRIVTSHTYSSIILPVTDGTVIHLRKAGRPEPVHEEIYNKLQINLDHLTTRKSVINKK